MPILRFSLLLTTFSLFVLPPAIAQSLGRVEQINSTSNAYYQHVEGGAETVQVQVLGAVGAPGLYEVTQGTSLGQLVSLSGGPTMGTRMRVNKRTVTVNLFRASANMDTPFYTSDFTESILNPERYPELLDGDVVTVEVIERQGISWRDIVALANTVGVLLFAIDRIRG